MDKEIDDIKAVEEMKQQEAVGYRELLLPWVRTMLIVGVGLAIIQQLSGINTVIYFAPSILQATGFDASAAILGTVGVGIMNTLMTVVAIVLLDRVGRRVLLLVGLVVMTVSLGTLGLIYLLFGLSGVVGYAALACVTVYVACWCPRRARPWGAAAWVFVYLLVPETKERSLEEIEADLRERAAV